MPGADNWFCWPSAAHPRPVVLVHGTVEAPALNWAAIAPTLKNQGYCVFALTYGENALSWGGRFPGLEDIADSARELRSFVDQVRFFTGASKVNKLIGLAPSNHARPSAGCPSSAALNLLGLANTFLGLIAPALEQQEVGSAFQRQLFGDGDTVPGPSYQRRNILIQEPVPDGSDRAHRHLVRLADDPERAQRARTQRPALPSHLLRVRNRRLNIPYRNPTHRSSRPRSVGRDD